MILTTLADWLKWSTDYRTLPYVCKSPLADEHVLSWKHMWERASSTSFVLESGKGGRYSYLGICPRSIVRGKGTCAEIIEVNHGVEHDKSIPCIQGTPVEVVKNWMAPYRTPYVNGTPHFIGGCVGYWGYDVVRTIEKLPELAENDLSLPDYCFAMYDEIWIIDHQDKQLYIAIHQHLDQQKEKNNANLELLFEHTQNKVNEMLHQWQTSVQLSHQRDQPYESFTEQQLFDVNTIRGISSSFPKKDFIHSVKKIQEYIRQGDVFQVNLSVRQSRRLNTSPESIYEALRRVNPSPYMGLLRFSTFSIASGSPELLVQSVRGQLRTRPIAGTRPRGSNEIEDQQLAEDLIHNEKERAEHIMLVDLERNDLGRISKYGTVKVKEFMVIEPYSHVMHIVSEITGELVDGKNAFDVIQATFPGGTVTGAPKVRTMEIIEELEPVRRGPYTGSMGWIDYNGNMEFNIIIRTLVSSEGIGYVQAGAGIVIDSDPNKEYIESLHKAKAMWKAIIHSEHSIDVYETRANPTKIEED